MYFEDIETGAVREFGEYKVTAEEIIEFASKYDPQPFHLSEEAGRQMHFGGLCASGWHTCAMVMRMLVGDQMGVETGALDSPGVDELRWTKPVYPGDILRVKSTVMDKKESRSKPYMGIVVLQNEIFNQNDELVLSFKPTVMYRRRNSGE